MFLRLAERRCGHTVRPDEPEPAVVRRDPRASSVSCLPTTHVSTSPTAKLCHCLSKPAAPHRELLRLWAPHLPASPAGPSLSPGVCATASTCPGECGFSHTCDHKWVRDAFGPLYFHTEYSQVHLPHPFWSTLIFPTGLVHPRHQLQSLGNQKARSMKLTRRSRAHSGGTHSPGCW